MQPELSTLVIHTGGSNSNVIAQKDWYAWGVRVFWPYPGCDRFAVGCSVTDTHGTPRIIIGPKTRVSGTGRRCQTAILRLYLPVSMRMSPTSPRRT